ncbi:hypothetical protein FB451DRAFT_1374724 [Mycena latifolia]|nr:hypothetical protein FB451DRAFT_1374724 [Mycena latifolia]
MERMPVIMGEKVRFGFGSRGGDQSSYGHFMTDGCTHNDKSRKPTRNSPGIDRQGTKERPRDVCDIEILQEGTGNSNPFARFGEIRVKKTLKQCEPVRSKVDILQTKSMQIGELRVLEIGHHEPCRKDIKTVGKCSGGHPSPPLEADRQRTHGFQGRKEVGKVAENDGSHGDDHAMEGLQAAEVPGAVKPKDMQSVPLEVDRVPIGWWWPVIRAMN